MKKLSALIFSSATYFTLVPSVFAAFPETPINPCPQGGGVGFDVLCSLDLEGGVIGTLITVAFILAVLIALVFLIFGGIRWIISGGDKTKVEEARGTIVAALVGLVLVFLAFFIINFILTFFNLGGVSNLTIPTLP